MTDDNAASATDEEPDIVRRDDLSPDDDPAHDLDGPDPFRPAAPVALDEERLGLALHDLEWNCPGGCGNDEAAAKRLHENDARHIAEAYAALSEQP